MEVLFVILAFLSSYKYVTSLIPNDDKVFWDSRPKWHRPAVRTFFSVMITFVLWIICNVIIYLFVKLGSL